jgi:hypothetical protein
LLSSKIDHKIEKYIALIKLTQVLVKERHSSRSGKQVRKQVDFVERTTKPSKIWHVVESAKVVDPTDMAVFLRENEERCALFRGTSSGIFKHLL